MKGDTTRNLIEIKRIIKEEYEQLYVHIFYDLDTNGIIPWKTQAVKMHTGRNKKI